MDGDYVYVMEPEKTHGQELRNNKTMFRWSGPVGMVVTARAGMRLMRQTALFLVLLSALRTSLAAAQSGGCDPDTGDIHQYLLNRYTVIATDSDAADVRTNLGIPLLTPNQIGFVTDTLVCHQASSAYTAAQGDSVVGRSVYVFRLGDDYLVVDKQVFAGEFLIGWLFDGTFTPIMKIAA